MCERVIRSGRAVFGSLFSSAHLGICDYPLTATEGAFLTLSAIMRKRLAMPSSHFLSPPPFSSVSLYHSFFTGIMTSLLHTSQFPLYYFICDYGCNDSFFFLFRWFSTVLFIYAAKVAVERDFVFL